MMVTRRTKQKVRHSSHTVKLHWRLFAAAGLALAIGAGLLAVDMEPATRVLAGWDCGVLLYLSLIFSQARRGDIARLRKRAAEEDENAIALLLLTFAAAVASFAAVVIELAGARDAEGLRAVLSIILAISTIVLSWFFVHAEFALHYAHEFYGQGRDKKIGGLEFPGGQSPDYWDFLYFSLVVGMTCQVSDVEISSRSLRGVVTMQGVLSFFFNLVILALTVNMLTNLIGGD
jgi:uncharacterized membrane protein